MQLCFLLMNIFLGLRNIALDHVQLPANGVDQFLLACDLVVQDRQLYHRAVLVLLHLIQQLVLVFDLFLKFLLFIFKVFFLLGLLSNQRAQDIEE